MLDKTHRLQDAILRAPAAAKAMCEGRVVVINSPTHRNSLAVILRAESGTASGMTTAAGEDRRYHVLIMTDADRGSAADPGAPAEDLPLPLTRVFRPAGKLGYELAVVSGYDILVISKEKLRVQPKDILDRRDEQERVAAAQELLRLAQKRPAGPKPLDVVKDLNMRDIDIAELWHQLTQARAALETMPCAEHPDFVALYGRLHQRERVQTQVRHLQHQMSDEALLLLPEYHQRVAVLKALKYTDPDGAVQLKGRVACEVTTCDELLLTELIFNSIFSPLEPEEIVALLSALVFQQARCSEPTLTKRLEDNAAIITSMAKEIAVTQQQCGMDTPPDVYIRDLHFGLVEVVYEWARGMPFQQITGLTDVQEGSIVRCIVRLDETCRDVRNAARVIGDPVLYEKMERASQMIKRDIVFAASLYTT